MDNLDIPILKKTYEVYSLFHDYRKVVSKSDRFTIYERSENLIIDLVELFLEAGYSKSVSKSSTLEKASVKLNTLRFFIRLMKETKVIDLKKYTALQEKIDEIGRMLGGWIRSNSSK
jgi:hypothetical protein